MSQCIEKFSDQIQRKHIITVSSLYCIVLYCIVLYYEALY